MARGPQLSRRRRVLEGAVLTYAAVAFTVVQGILLVPLYLHRIPIELYGAWLATGSVLGWLELADPGVSSILQQRVAFGAAANDNTVLGRTIGSGLLLASISGLIPVLALPLGGWLGDVVGTTGAQRYELARAFSLGLIGVGVGIVGNALSGVAIGFQEVRAAGLVSLGGLVAGVAATVAGLLGGLGLLALPLGAVTRNTVACVSASFLLRRLGREHRLRLSIAVEELRGLLGEASYTFVSRIGVVLLSRLDALLSATLLSPTATVVLTLTGRVIDVVRLTADRIGSAAMPVLAQIAGEEGSARAGEAQRTVNRYAVLVLGVLGGTAVAWNRQFVTLWVGADKFGGPALTLGLAAYGCCASYMATTAQGVFAIGGIREISLIGLAEGVGRLLLQFLLVASLGLMGFPLAAVLALALVTLPAMARVLAGRHGGHPWPRAATILRAWGTIGVFAVLGSTLNWVNPWAPSWALLIIGVPVTALVLSVVALGVLPDVRKDVARWLLRERVA